MLSFRRRPGNDLERKTQRQDHIVLVHLLMGALCRFRPRVAFPFGHTSRLCEMCRGDVFIFDDSFLQNKHALLYSKGRKRMKNNVCFLMAVFVALVASAMPTKQELSKARTIVQELMAPVMNEYQAKTKTAVEVADASVGYAKMSKDEAVRFLFLRGTINYYVIGEDYKKASDTIEELKKNIKDLPPSEIVALLKRAHRQGTLQKSPRLESVFQLAEAQIQAEDDIKKIRGSLQTVSSAVLYRQYAEALAVCGKWNAALSEFGKCGGEIAKIAQHINDIYIYRR